MKHWWNLLVSGSKRHLPGPQRRPTVPSRVSRVRGPWTPGACAPMVANLRATGGLAEKCFFSSFVKTHLRVITMPDEEGK